ncbi:hypothetical protein CAI21_08190 [Alkalilimnicola ehrlichii]|uniref:Multidrug resistance protein MdtA-like barrel-sandwich hybrid domain-containing protein n=1 Tax=Alkalilimnicola ehrlichii TaxID=351052 RepID=A0A3E0WWX3_9GAMM|nr:HlyD family efflux transporter periplasmic adaptor subunit [Alkalilimnicola ehrlichii]RFA30156.1 hypothetical protein CAI21_08190 [Alkalilimnicola ehrlichii]RFA37504.1 hypothetical protein CAL65_09535 [Alkalilimnicola ehrlichii]
MKRSKTVAFGVIGGLFVGLIGFGLIAAQKPGPEWLHGEVEVREVRVAAKVTGRVASMPVREGDWIEAGDLLFELDGPEIRARYEQALAAQEAAEAMRDQAEAGARSEEVEMARLEWKRAQAQAELADTSYQRIQAMADDGLVPRQQRDEAYAQWVGAREQANAAHARYQMTRAGARQEERRASEAQARQAAAARAEAEAIKEETRSVAPRSGEVATIAVEQGELAAAGFPVLTLADPTDTWVVFNVREDRLRGLQPGVEFDAFVPALEASYTFKVTRLSALPDFATWKAARGTPGYDLRTFQLEARPVEQVDGLRAGMTVIYRAE